MHFWILCAYIGLSHATFIDNLKFPKTHNGIVTNGAAASTVFPTTTLPTILPPTGFPSSTTPFPSTTTPFPLIDPRVGNQIPTKLINDDTIKFGNEAGFKSKRKTSHKRQKRQVNCGCYTIAQCPNTDGTGLIDPRIVFPANATQPCATGFKFCCPTSLPQQSCGSRLQTSIIYPTTSGQAKYGDYPWMVAILGAIDNSYIGGGVLIDAQHVLTTAHRISNFTNGVGLKIRLGEWDFSANFEQYPFRDFNISRVTIHESYNPSTLQNDLALIRMTTPLPPDAQGVVPICMPTATQNFDGQRCWVAGWGKDAFSATGFQTVLKVVDVPILPAASCETTLRTTRLGAAYVLDRAAFICAGGELNKDSCTGDGGSGLVCETTAGRWTLAGLVAWGLGCGTQGVPAAYVNVPNYMAWIAGRQTAA